MQIANAAVDNDSDTFVEKLLNILTNRLPIKAATLYSYNPNDKLLILRGQSGLSYDLFQSFELPLNTYAGKAVREKKPSIIRDITKSPDLFRDKLLIRAHELKSLVTIPIYFNNHESSTEIHSKKPISVLCVYPRQAEALDPLRNLLSNISRFISLLYLTSLERKKMSMRRILVARAGYSHDMGSLMHRANNVLKTLFNFEGCSIFLGDMRNEFLRLQATSGLQGEVEKRSFFYSSSSNDPTYLAYREGRNRFFHNDRVVFQNFINPETLASPQQNCILLPFKQAAVNHWEEKRVIGLLRGFNRVLKHGNRELVTAFGWEEIDQIHFFGEMVAVLVHFMSKGLNAAYDFNRSLHSAKNNLQAANNNLQILNSLDLDIPLDFQHGIPNSIAFLTDILAQISRLELKNDEKLKMREVALYGDVLAKLPNMVYMAAQASEIGTFHITNFKEAGFDELPMVLGNKEALFSVFRNLAENSIKYCKSSKKRHILNFSYAIQQDMVRVLVTDDGIGIDQKYANSIFIEGYRTEEAMGRHPTSNGMGLSDSRELMEKMGGSIDLLPHRGGAQFEVLIPLYSRRETV